MNNWLFALQLIPLITSLMKTAESILGSGAGIQKKEFVKDGVKQTVKGMSELSTGGQKQTWQMIDLFIVPMSGLIDTIAALLFPNGKK